jgi:hypothetical protein
MVLNSSVQAVLQQRILQNINVFSKISKENTSFYHIHEKYNVSSTFLYNGNSKCDVRILYAISFQWSKCQIIWSLLISTYWESTGWIFSKYFFGRNRSYNQIWFLPMWQPLAMNFNIWIILNTNGSTYYRINQK